MSTGKLPRTVPTYCFSWTWKLVVKKGLRHESRKSFAVNAGFLLFGWSASIGSGHHCSVITASAPSDAAGCRSGGLFAEIEFVPFEEIPGVYPDFMLLETIEDGGKGLRPRLEFVAGGVVGWNSGTVHAGLILKRGAPAGLPGLKGVDSPLLIRTL
jgi:hypothetical protein